MMLFEVQPVIIVHSKRKRKKSNTRSKKWKSKTMNAETTLKMNKQEFQQAAGE